MSLAEIRDRDAAPMIAAPAPVADPLAIVARLAENPNVDPDKLVKLYELAERSRAARAKEAFNAAIAAAKGEIGPIYKNKTVDFTSQKGRTNYRHEDFAEVARTVDPVLSRHGISYRYKSTQVGGRVSVTCILSHADGYSEDTTLEAGEDSTGNKNAHQAIGSAATYLQRYTLKLALGLAATTDDDARSAAPKPHETPARSESAQRYFDGAVGRLDAAADAATLKKWWNSEEAKKERVDMLDRASQAELLALAKTRIGELENAAAN